MHKSKMAAIAILKNVISSLFAEKIFNTAFQSVISTINSFIRFNFILRCRVDA